MGPSVQPGYFNDGEKRWRGFVLPLAAFLLAAFVFFFRLGSYPLINPDEGRNAQVALEMHDSGAWLVPTLNGYPYLDKPAFYFRLVALSIAALGKNEASARLPSSLFAMALCILVYFFCRRVYGSRLAALAVVVFASIPLVMVFARIVIFDMPLAFFTAASIVSAFLAEESVGRKQRIYEILGAAAAGFGTLVKGPVGFVVPALVIFFFDIMRRKPRAILRIVHPINLLVFLAVVLPWFIGVSLKQPDFFHYGLVEETLRRYTTPSFKRTGPIWYYLPVLAGVLFPYSLIVPGAILSAWRFRKILGPADRLFMVWALVVVIFFSTSHSKLPGYILSAMFPVGILIARFFEAALLHPSGRSGRLIFAAVLGLSLISAALISLLLYDRFYPGIFTSLFHIPSETYDLMRPSFALMVSSFTVILVMAVLVCLIRRVELALIFFLILPVGLFTVSFQEIAHHGEAKSFRRLAARLSELPEDTVIGCLASFPLGLRFYLDRPFVLITGDGSELTSNYVQYELQKQQTWPPGFVHIRDRDDWLVTQKQPVFLLSEKNGRFVLEKMAAYRGVNISEWFPGWWGAYLPKTNLQGSAVHQ